MDGGVTGRWPSCPRISPGGRAGPSSRFRWQFFDRWGNERRDGRTLEGQGMLVIRAKRCCRWNALGDRSDHRDPSAEWAGILHVNKGNMGGGLLILTW